MASAEAFPPPRSGRRRSRLRRLRDVEQGFSEAAMFALESTSVMELHATRIAELERRAVWLRRLLLVLVLVSLVRCLTGCGGGAPPAPHQRPPPPRRQPAWRRSEQRRRAGWGRIWWPLRGHGSRGEHFGNPGSSWRRWRSGQQQHRKCRRASVSRFSVQHIGMAGARVCELADVDASARPRWRRFDPLAKRHASGGGAMVRARSRGRRDAAGTRAAHGGGVRHAASGRA
jgi:hypothetical protein